MSDDQENVPPPVTDAGLKDFGKLAAVGSQKRQSMRGFDDDYVDIVDYILRCTHKIWEERGIGLIDTHYLHNCTLHTSTGLVYGRDQVVANTLQTLAMFPDRQLFGDDVIWSGNDVDGFYTSHRITSLAHHRGYSHYGPPTGRKLRYRVIAECLVKENRICEEWLVRDELSIVRQMGLDEHAVIAALARKLAASGTPPEAQAPVGPQLGQLPTPELPPSLKPGFDIEDFVRRAWHDIWNRRMLNRVSAAYVPTYECHSASGRELYGHDELINFIICWLGAFPDGRMNIDHFAALGNDHDGYRVAVRWTFLGTHEGHGLYGSPTGRRIRVMGLTHQHIKNSRFVQEWTVFDELALLAQLYTE